MASVKSAATKNEYEKAPWTCCGTP